MNLEMRSVKWLQDKLGWPLAARVSCYNAHSRRNRDLFGIIDVLAVGPAGSIFVQVTSNDNMSARIKKMCQENFEVTMALVEAPGVMVEVWGWRKVGRFWEPRIIHLSSSMVETIHLGAGEYDE